MTTSPFTGYRILSKPNRWLHVLFFLCVSLPFIFVNSNCYGASNSKSFDFDSIQAQIKTLSSQLKNSALSRHEIDKAREESEGFQRKSAACIEASTAQINRLDQEILSLGPVADHEPLDTARERKRLLREKQSQQVLLSECRLISTLALRLKNDLSDQADIRRKADFFSKTDHYYDKILASIPSWNKLKSQVAAYFSSRSGLSDLSLAEILILVLFTTGGAWAGWKFSRFLEHHLALFNQEHPLQQKQVFKRRLETSVAFASLAGGCYIFYFFLDTISEVYAPWLFLCVFLYGFSILLFYVHCFFKQCSKPSTSGTLSFPSIRPLVFFCVLLFFSTRLDLAGFSELRAPLALAQSVVICAICLTGWRFLWSLALPSGFARAQGVLRISIAIFFAVVLIAELSGYRNLSIFLIKGLFSTYLLSILLGMMLLAINEIIGGFFLGKYRWQQKVRSVLGISSDESLMGILGLGFIFKLLVWCTAFFLLLQAWGLSSEQRKGIYSSLVNGLHFGNLVIAPARILMGIFIFACCWIFVSWIKIRLERTWLQHSHVSRSAQETLVTSTGYAGFALALVIGLAIAGVSFSNLAVIAGALSVGIGFGLQNIVNNFVSGLIILFERPVKRGDWICVGNTEGYVRKISVRSTLIQTFDRSDVIVPNSELIANQVTNMMLHDMYGRLRVPVGVAYGSDTELVRTILLDIAKANDKVINDNRAPMPHVLFLEFGDSSLNFELRCYLSNIDDRLFAKSEINYEIDRQFRKHNISIPFPQRDIYIKEMPSQKKAEQEGT